MKSLIDQQQGIRFAGESEALYRRMLSRFSFDPTIKRLKDAFSRLDRQDAFLQAHTLKGLCSQLALPALEGEAADLCCLLRSEEHMPASVPESLLAVYAKTVEAIDNFLENP